MKKGFTLLELMVSLAIFAFMTAFLLAKYGTFNQTVILTDLAYDTAIDVRNAQGSALDVEGASSTGAGFVFNNVYGVHFTSGSNSFVYFVNPSAFSSNPGDTYVAGGSNPSQIISTYTMKAGDSVSGICVIAGNGTQPCSSSPVPSLDVSFQRPNPDAILSASVSGGAVSTYSYADITITGSDGETRDIVIEGTGEISVIN